MGDVILKVTGDRLKHLQMKGLYKKLDHEKNMCISRSLWKSENYFLSRILLKNQYSCGLFPFSLSSYETKWLNDLSRKSIASLGGSHICILGMIFPTSLTIEIEG